MDNKLNVLVVGCGNMGASHARAYHKIPDYHIAGLVSRGPERRQALMEQIGQYPGYDDFETALKTTQPDVVSINTYPDTHASYAIKSLESGAHVFLEKPIALTTEEAQKVVDCAVSNNRKLVIGYILRVHPAWKKFTELSQSLGKPLVMRMNLNQQSAGQNWLTHKSLMESMSPIVDCGVHYVDVMCQMTRSKPVSVSAIGARLSGEVDADMYNYGQLQVKFADGSVGWYEAGWGPMMSETAYFIKDVIGPKGAVSIVESPKGEIRRTLMATHKPVVLKSTTVNWMKRGNLSEKMNFSILPMNPITMSFVRWSNCFCWTPYRMTKTCQTTWPMQSAACA